MLYEDVCRFLLHFFLSKKEENVTNIYGLNKIFSFAKNVLVDVCML